MNRKIIAVAMLSILLCELSLANTNVTQISRYQTISNKPQVFQRQLLSQIIKIRFTRNIETVGDAIKYLLKFSGYSLIAENQMNSALKIMIKNPLPIAQRELGPIPLKDALLILVGPAFYLVQDPVNRILNFKIKPEYQRFINTTHKNRG